MSDLVAQHWLQYQNLLLWEAGKHGDRNGHGFFLSLAWLPCCPSPHATQMSSSVPWPTHLPKLFYTTATEHYSNCWQERPEIMLSNNIILIICGLRKNFYAGLHRLLFYLQICKLWIIILKGRWLHIKPALQSIGNRTGSNFRRGMAEMWLPREGSGKPSHMQKLLFQ